MQNTQQRVGDLERNLKDDIQAKMKEIMRGVNNSEQAVIFELEKVQEQNKVMKWLAIGSIVLTLSGFSGHFYKILNSHNSF